MTTASPTSASPAPIVTQAADRLRTDIISGAFAPGAKLKIQELQSDYGFSSSPLREALNRLSQEGLVQADAGRGFRAPELSLSDFIDITGLRLLVDLEALRKSIELGDDQWESEIVASYYRLEKVESRLGSGPVALDNEWATAHKSFHSMLISSCNSPRLIQFSSALFDQADRYRRISARARQRPRNKSKEHKQLMDATLQRNVDLAGILLRDHINHTKENVAKTLDPRHSEG
ncbi:GntR family transcriptional regulator [Brevibacterium aurantiacum]|uniref:GntR family transcriptional regulator n=1 Tax=Brevibacterium aurantiacum TaxID=273384 RepID=UPI001867C272|nr:FCD domain-containing protein [Brevibacterium aurantiacum]